MSMGSNISMTMTLKNTDHKFKLSLQGEELRKENYVNNGLFINFSSEGVDIARYGQRIP